MTDTDKPDDVTKTAKTDTPDVTTTPSSDETTNVNPETEPTEPQSLRNPKRKKNVSFTTTYLLKFVFVTLNRPYNKYNLSKRNRLQKRYSKKSEAIVKCQ